LFVKFFKLVKECKPKFFVAENVLGILDDQYDVIRKTAFRQVEDDYALIDPMKFKASDFGAPTSRERVFFIGYRRDALSNLSKEDFEKQKVSEITTVAKALQGLPTRINSEWLSEEQSWRPVKPLSTPYFKKYVDGNIPDGMGDVEAVRLYKEEGLISGNFGTRHSPEVQKRYEKLKPGQNDPVSRSVRLKKMGCALHFEQEPVQTKEAIKRFVPFTQRHIELLHLAKPLDYKVFLIGSNSHHRSGIVLDKLEIV